MQRKIIEEANEIIQAIDCEKKAVERLQKYDEEKGLTLYFYAEHGYSGYQLKGDMHFEPWEVRLMIHNKQQRIQALEKQLEEL